MAESLSNARHDKRCLEAPPARRAPGLARFALAASLLLLAGCSGLFPNPTPSPTHRPPPAARPTPSPVPSPTPEAPAKFPLPVVTGQTGFRSTITTAEVSAHLALGTILVPCEVSVVIGSVVRPAGSTECLAGLRIPAALAGDPQALALLPPGLVSPATKVLRIGPADPFGGPGARRHYYPVRGSAIGLPESWTDYDPDEIRNLMSLGDSCPDRGVAYQAITLGRGWPWVFDGGHAIYRRIYPNPVAPGSVGYGFNIVDAVPAGDTGAVARLVRDADVTVDDFECPVVDTWQVNGGTVFSIDPAVLPHLRDDFGVDVATLAANHVMDQGVAGLLETIAKFYAAGIPITGMGADLEAALEPALVEVGGMTFAFVGFNEIPGASPAGVDQPGVAWINQANAEEAVRRAREAGAALVFCMPQWGLPEYRSGWSALQIQHQAMFYAAGCDHILGSGTHWAGPIGFSRTDDAAPHYAIGSHGNFLFGQDWSQETQEGVIVEFVFRGTEVAQVRLYPYIILDQAQPALTDPLTDGAHVLRRVYDSSGWTY